jgi:hypothetical protein
MERNRDTSGRVRWWKYAPKVVWIDQFRHDGFGAVTKLNEQVLTFTEATPHEKDLLTARDRPVVWVDLLKGNRRIGASLGGRECKLGDCLMRTRGRR